MPLPNIGIKNNITIKDGLEAKLGDNVKMPDGKLTPASRRMYTDNEKPKPKETQKTKPKSKQRRRYRKRKPITTTTTAAPPYVFYPTPHPDQQRGYTYILNNTQLVPLQPEAPEPVFWNKELLESLNVESILEEKDFSHKGNEKVTLTMENNEKNVKPQHFLKDLPKNKRKASKQYATRRSFSDTKDEVFHNKYTNRMDQEKRMNYLMRTKDVPKIRNVDHDRYVHDQFKSVPTRKRKRKDSNFQEKAKRTNTDFENIGYKSHQVYESYPAHKTKKQYRSKKTDGINQVKKPSHEKNNLKKGVLPSLRREISVPDVEYGFVPSQTSMGLRDRFVPAQISNARRKYKPLPSPESYTVDTKTVSKLDNLEQPLRSNHSKRGLEKPQKAKSLRDKFSSQQISNNRKKYNYVEKNMNTKLNQFQKSRPVHLKKDLARHDQQKRKYKMATKRKQDMKSTSRLNVENRLDYFRSEYSVANKESTPTETAPQYLSNDPFKTKQIKVKRFQRKGQKVAKPEITKGPDVLGEFRKKWQRAEERFHQEPVPTERSQSLSSSTARHLEKLVQSPPSGGAEEKVYIVYPDTSGHSAGWATMSGSCANFLIAGIGLGEFDNWKRKGRTSTKVFRGEGKGETGPQWGYWTHQPGDLR